MVRQAMHTSYNSENGASHGVWNRLRQEGRRKSTVDIYPLTLINLFNLKKNLEASKSSEHPPRRGGGGIANCERCLIVGGKED